VKSVLSLKQAILATINYFNILDFPLTLGEVEDYLYGWTAPQEVIGNEIRGLPEIVKKDGLYCLKGRESLCEARKKREKINSKLWKRARRFSWLFAVCPFVRMVAVCNTLAYGNAKETSDIDVFIVVKEGKLGTARFFAKLLTQIFGVRVHHDKIAGRFCLSFFVTEKALNLGDLAHQFDPHLAYFTRMMVPIFGEEVYKKFINENAQWTAEYLKKPFKPLLKEIKSHPISRIFQFVFELILNLGGCPLEAFLYNHQVKRDNIRKKLFPNSKGIVINKNVFKFHEEDPRELISERFSSIQIQAL
jgi:predicted nucleotidyltransferase